MKKAITFLLVITLSITSLAALDYKFSLGFQDKDTNLYHHDPFYVSFALLQDIGDFEIYGSSTSEIKNGIEEFEISSSQFNFAIGVSYRISMIEVLLEHQVYHHIAIYGSSDGVNGACTKVEINISSKSFNK
jgi:hypothetical protein